MSRALILTVVVALLGLAAGCSNEESGPVRFLVFGDPEELAAYRTLVCAYEKEEPTADVELVEASDRSDLIARLSTSIAGGSPPDLFLINYRFYGQFAAKRAIEPMAERLGATDAFEADDFYPRALEAFQWRGEQLCLPQNVSSLVVYYNRNLFRRFRVPEPRTGWTWTELVVKAGQLTRDAQDRVALGGDPDTAGGVRPVVYGLGVEPTLIRLAPFVWSNGGELVDDERRPTRLTLDTPQARQALQSFLDLRAQGVVPTDEDVEAEDDESRFANGRLGMLLSSRRSTTTFRTITEFEWDVAPLPRHLEPAGILHSDAYCTSAASKRKNAAWRFVEFALGPEGQRIVARTGRTVPSLISVSRSEAFLDPSQPPRTRVFLDAIPTIRRLPSISTWPEIEDATEGVLENGFYLGQPVEHVIRELDRVTRPIFARAETS